MSKKTIKVESILNEQDLAGLLEALANMGKKQMDEKLDIDGFRKLKLSIERKFGQIYAKIKVETPHTGTSQAEENSCGSSDEEHITYSKLKKRMKSSFLAIKVNLAEGQFPPEEAVESFLSDSGKMICYPGNGDEFYQDYHEATKALATAWGTKDMKAMQAAYDHLHSRMRECHTKYK